MHRRPPAPAELHPTVDVCSNIWAPVGLYPSNPRILATPPCQLMQE